MNKDITYEDQVRAVQDLEGPICWNAREIGDFEATIKGGPCKDRHALYRDALQRALHSPDDKPTSFEVPKDAHDEIKAGLLEHYAMHQPHVFIACDGVADHELGGPWHRVEWQEGESPWRRVCELMRDVDVRVLINPRLPLGQAASLLRCMVNQLEWGEAAAQDRAIWESAQGEPFNDHYPYESGELADLGI